MSDIVNKIKALGIENKLYEIYSSKLKEVYAYLADVLFLEYNLSASADDIESFINSYQSEHLTDSQLLNMMIKDVKDVLFGAGAGGLSFEEKMEYMKLLQNLLTTKHKLIGIEKEQQDNDVDAAKLRTALERAGIKFSRGDKK